MFGAINKNSNIKPTFLTSRKICKFHACECVYAHKFNLKYKIYVRWSVIVFFGSYI